MRVAILILLCSSTAFADISEYECAPGTPVKGVGCKCPATHVSKVDGGTATCAEKPKNQPPGGGYKPGGGGGNYDTLVAQANDLADAYNCTKAEDVYQQALKINPRGLEALVGSGNCMAKQSKWTNAQLRFDKALSINPKYEPALWGKAEAYRLAYKKDDAIAAYKQYLDVYPNAYKAKAALDKLQGKSDVAVEKPAPPPPPPADPSRPNPGGGNGRYKNTRDVQVVVSGSQVTLNGVKVSGTPQLADIERIYGKSDRIWDTGASNRVYTWDNLGIVVYEPRDGRCISTTFPYKPMDSSYTPKTNFGGSITVDGKAVTQYLDIPTLAARPGATQPYGKDSLIFDKGDIHVFSIAKGGGTSVLDLVEISYWQQNKAGTNANNGNSNSGGKVASAADVRVSVTSAGKVSLQGVEVGSRPRLADIEKIYGKADRVWDTKGGANRIHTWDNLGFIVYEPYDGRAISLTMPYKSMGNSFSPTTLFKGRVELDTRGFYNFNTLGTIKNRQGATQPYGDDSVVFDLGDIHVFTKAKAATVETIDLVEVSFWQKK